MRCEQWLGYAVNLITPLDRHPAESLCAQTYLGVPGLQIDLLCAEMQQEIGQAILVCIHKTAAYRARAHRAEFHRPWQNIFSVAGRRRQDRNRYNSLTFKV